MTQSTPEYKKTLNEIENMIENNDPLLSVNFEKDYITPTESCNDKQFKELIEAQNKYIKLLEDGMGDLFSIAITHGYRANKSDIEAGQQFRDKISELKTKCGLISGES